MRIIQQGDRVLIHYTKRLEKGSVKSSRRGQPLEITVGTPHSRLPGLGLKLVGMAPGEKTFFTVPAERAYGLPKTEHIRRLPRERFPGPENLKVGQWVKIPTNKGQNRWVRILKLTPQGVVVDTNHRFAGQFVEVNVQFVDFCDQETSQTTLAPEGEPTPNQATADLFSSSGGPVLDLNRIKQVITFSVDEESLLTLKKAFPHWNIQVIENTSSNTFAENWHPGDADLIVFGARDKESVTQGMCRFLKLCGPYSEDIHQDEQPNDVHPDMIVEHKRIAAPILVLVPFGEENMIKAALEAGAHSCLMLPIHQKEVRTMLARYFEGNQPGRHTLNLQHPQAKNIWRDEGGEG